MKRGLQGNHIFLQGLNEITIHDACRKRNTSESMIAACVRRIGDYVPQPAVLEILKAIWFLCGKDTAEKYFRLQQKLPFSRRNHVYTVKKLTVRETILQAAERRGDEWAQQTIRAPQS